MTSNQYSTIKMCLQEPFLTICQWLACLSNDKALLDLRRAPPPLVADSHTKARVPSGPAAFAFATTARATGVVRRALAVCDTLFARAARPARDHSPRRRRRLLRRRIAARRSALRAGPRPAFARLQTLPRRIFCTAGTEESVVFMSPTSEPSIEPPEGFAVLQEGKARILTQLNDVFYNKAQVVNRDIRSPCCASSRRSARRSTRATSARPRTRGTKGTCARRPGTRPFCRTCSARRRSSRCTSR